MATQMPNRAQVEYTYDTTQNSATSNTIYTTLLDEYAIAVEKTAVTEQVRAGEAAFYRVKIDNTGNGALKNVKLADNMAGTLLRYVNNTARFYVDDEEVTGEAVVETDNSVSFTIPSQLRSGESLVILYAATLADSATQPVVNSVRAIASPTGEGQAVTATDTATVTPIRAAELSVVKVADKSTVQVGDSLTYTIVLTNRGTVAAEAVKFTDALPPEFTVTSVSYTTNSVVTPVTNTDYAITAPNTISFPIASSSLVITVPAATAAGEGITKINITGTIN